MISATEALAITNKANKELINTQVSQSAQSGYREVQVSSVRVDEKIKEELTELGFIVQNNIVGMVTISW